MLTPTLHPWYLTWIIPLLCFYFNRAWIILTGSIVFCYTVLIEFNRTGIWQEIHWLKLPEYLPFYLMLGFYWIKGVLTKRRWLAKSEI